MFKWKIVLSPISIFTMIAILISAVTTTIPKVENALLSSAQTMLNETKNNWAQLEVNGQTLTLKGQAPLLEIQTEVKDNLIELVGVNSLIDQSTLSAPEKPYIFTAIRENNRIIIEGGVPARSTKDQIFEYLRVSFPNLEVVDKTRFASGVGDQNSWYKGVNYSLSQLARLDSGKITLTDRNLDVEGVTQNAEKYDMLKVALQVLPEPLRLNKNSISITQPVNYELSLARIGSVVTINGFVPSEDIRKNVLENLTKHISGLSYKDNLRIAQGAPQNFNLVLDTALQLIHLVHSSEFIYSNNQVSIKASPQPYEQYEAITNLLKPLETAGITTNLMQLVVPQKPLIPLTGVWDGKTFRLSGDMPNEKVLDFLDKQLKLQQGSVFENATILRDASTKLDYTIALRHIVQSLKWSKSMTFTIEEAGLTVQLQAIDSIAYSIASQYFSRPLGVKIVSSKIDAPILSPYSWAIQKEGSTIELTGFVPNNQLRAQYLDLARKLSSGGSIIDTMNFASTTLPENELLTSIEFALELSKFLKKSAIFFTDMTLNISGQANNTNDYIKVKDLLRDVPRSIRVKTIAIEPPSSANFFWKIEKNNAQIVLSGFVRHEHDQTTLYDALSHHNLKYTGAWGIEGGAPVHFQELALQIIRSISDLDTASVEIRMQNVKIVANANSPLSEFKLKKKLNALIDHKNGVKLTWDVRVQEPHLLTALECDQQVQQLVSSAVPAFSGVEVLPERKFSMAISKIATVLSHCPDALLEVFASGPDRVGQEFSADIANTRARIIAVDLVREGISHSRLRLMPIGVSAQLIQHQPLQLKVINSL